MSFQNAGTDPGEEHDITRQIRTAGDLIRSVYAKISRIESKKHLFRDCTDLTLIEIDTLLATGYSGRKSMSQIAGELGVTLGTPTVTIDRLVKKGYVERIRDLEDRRQVFIRLSEKGRSTLGRILQMKERVTERVFSILSDEERICMIGAMSKINLCLDDIMRENP